MMDDRSFQRALTALGVYAGEIDGDIGSGTRKGIVALVSPRAKTSISGWTAQRLRVAAEQAILQSLDFYPEDSAIDGLAGSNTRDAWERWQNAQRVTNLAPAVEAIIAPSPKPTAFAAIRNAWPTQGGVPAFYGPVGKNQVAVATPYPMRLAWDKTKTVKAITLHAKVAPSATRVLARVHEKLGETKIRELGLDLFGGSLNVRKMRGGSAYSMHSWGIAIDFDPERNQLRWGRDRARLGKPDAAPFWALWEEEGWVGLGPARNYDWMHVQAALL